MYPGLDVTATELPYSCLERRRHHHDPCRGIPSQVLLCRSPQALHYVLKHFACKQYVLINYACMSDSAF